ncbi:MAG: sulfur carrier protein ThiS [Thiohalomonadaceae bacterium]
MRIYVNGEAREVPEDCTAEQLVVALGLTGRRLAMEVNLEIVPRSAYPAHRFKPDDRVEIVHAIGGGSGL